MVSGLVSCGDPASAAQQGLYYDPQHRKGLPHQTWEDFWKGGEEREGVR